MVISVAARRWRMCFSTQALNRFEGRRIPFCREAKIVYRVIGLCVALIIACAACAPAEGPKSMAESFVERYYVHADLPKARALAYGLALRKIEEEERPNVRMNGPCLRSVAWRTITGRSHPGGG